MIHSNLGELAALTSAACNVITPMAFETAGKKVGSLSVNFIRLISAFLLIGTFTLFSRGLFLPVDASSTAWRYLTVSGLIGFVIGDMFLFEAYVEVGARVSLLIMASVPPITAFIGFMFLGETLSFMDLLGMLITISGIALVILMKGTDKSKVKLAHPLKGLLFAFIGALGQAFGLIFSKYGMGNYNAFAAAQIRIIAGIIGFSIIITIRKYWKNIYMALKDKKSILFIIIGSIFGPFLGVCFALISVQYTATGITSTIMSISQVLIIPFSIVIFKEKVSFKEVLGAFITVCGVIILFI